MDLSRITLLTEYEIVGIDLISKGSVSSGSVGLFSGCIVSVVAGTIGGMLS